MHKITIDHFQRVQFLSAIALSSAGQPAWVGTKIQDDAYVSQLYILDQDQPKCLTQGHESLFIWDDEQTLLFPAVERNLSRKRRRQPFTASAPTAEKRFWHLRCRFGFGRFRL